MAHFPLKASMSSPTPELRQLGITLRGNLASKYSSTLMSIVISVASMKQSEWFDALGELQILLEQEPRDLKALYRYPE